MALTFIKLYGDFLEETERLTDAEVGRLICAMLRHLRGEEAPEAALTGNEAVLYPRWRLQIDRDRAAYEQICATNRRNGKLGGRPRAAASRGADTAPAQAIEAPERSEG